jgi:myo-inositol-1(or 4)-monophosphatase
VSVALEDAQGALAGVVLDPVRDELFTAERNRGTTLNGEQVRVRGATELGRALVATGFSYEPERRAEQAEVALNVLPKVRDLRRAGSAALDLAWVSAGRLDGFYERGVKPWDWAAGRLLVDEAGGATMDIPGEPYGLLAASPGLAEPLNALIT